MDTPLLKSVHSHRIDKGGNNRRCFSDYACVGGGGTILPLFFDLKPSDKEKGLSIVLDSPFSCGWRRLHRLGDDIGAASDEDHILLGR